MSFKTQTAKDMRKVFTNVNEFGELAVYTAPNGTVTNDVSCTVAMNAFPQEFSDYSGLGAIIVIDRTSLAMVHTHGELTLTSGDVFKVQMIINKDSDSFTVTAIADIRISPQGMR